MLPSDPSPDSDLPQTPLPLEYCAKGSAEQTGKVSEPSRWFSYIAVGIILAAIVMGFVLVSFALYVGLHMAIQ